MHYLNLFPDGPCVVGSEKIETDMKTNRGTNRETDIGIRQQLDIDDQIQESDAGYMEQENVRNKPNNPNNNNNNNDDVKVDEDEDYGVRRRERRDEHGRLGQGDSHDYDDDYDYLDEMNMDEVDHTQMLTSDIIGHQAYLGY